MALFKNPANPSIPSTFNPSPTETLTTFLKKNAVIILGVGLFVTFWMLVYTFVVFKPGYASKATVIVKDSAITGRYVEPDNYYAMQTTSSSSSNPVLNTMGILKSAAINDALWVYFQKQHPEELKKNKIETKKEWNTFYQDGSSFIKAKNQPGTDLIAIQFAWSDPVIAKEALAVVLTAFQNASRDLNRTEQVTRTRFLAKQVTDIEGQLNTIRKEKSTYQTEKKTVNVRREADDLAGTRMELANRINQMESQAKGKENVARRYQQLLGMNPEKALKAAALGQNLSLMKLQDELYRLEQQYSLLSTSLTETNPKVKELQAQIDRVKANLADEQTRTLGADSSSAGVPVVADTSRGEIVRAMLNAHGEALELRAQLAVIRARLGEVDSDISGFPQKAEGLANIEQKEASLSLALDQLRQKVLEARLKEEQTLSNVFIVDAPRLPDKAQFPNTTHLVVLSLLMGLGVGLASAFAKEQLTANNSYSAPQWLEPLENDKEEDSAESAPVPEPVASFQPPTRAAKISHPMDTLFTQQPTADKVDLPVVGSLFDSLVPVAGPMFHQQSQNQNIRRDLTRSLTSENTEAPIPNQKPVTLDDNQLLPPEFSAVSPARLVKVALTPSPITVAQAQAQHRENAALPMSHHDRIGIPTLHAAPAPIEIAPSPSASPIPEALPELDYAPDRPILNEPVQYKAPAQVTVAAEVPSPIVITPEADSATTFYEEQARQMPLPRRLRGVPAFLLNNEQTAAPEENQPYTLVSKKQLLNDSDDLMQDVAPLEAPAAPAHDSQLTPFPEALPTGDFQPRKPLISPLRLGKKPGRNPEAFFGIRNRKEKQAQLPTSLSRLMASAQGTPAGHGR